MFSDPRTYEGLARHGKRNGKRRNIGVRFAKRYLNRNERRSQRQQLTVKSYRENQAQETIQEVRLDLVEGPPPVPGYFDEFSFIPGIDDIEDCRCELCVPYRESFYLGVDLAYEDSYTGWNVRRDYEYAGRMSPGYDFDALFDEYEREQQDYDYLIEMEFECEGENEAIAELMEDDAPSSESFELYPEWY